MGEKLKLELLKALSDLAAGDGIKVNVVAAAGGVTINVDEADLAVLGATTGAAVITDANGTIQQYLRGLIKQWIAGTLVLGAGANLVGKVGIDQTTPGTTDSVSVSTAQGAGAALGAIAGAAVITDANGTIQQYLRGLVKRWADALGAGTAAAALRTTHASDDPLVAALGEVQGSPTANTVLDRLKALLTGIVVAAGSNLIGRAVADASAATGGIASTARLASAAASTNATNVKTAPGRVYGVQGLNAAAYPVYLVLYDAVTDPPVPGTTTIRKKIPIPALSAFALEWPVGLSFAAGIGYAFTKLAADADTTALAAADVLQFNLDYN